MADQPHVSTIVLNWNGAQDTIECLETVLKSDYINYNIVLVDNDSMDDSIDEILDWATDERYDLHTSFPELVYPLVKKPLHLHTLEMGKHDDPIESLRSQRMKEIPPGSIVLVKNFENAGFAVGNNLGIRVSRTLFQSHYFFILNNDAVIEKDTITRLVRTLESDRDIGAVTAAIYDYSRPDTLANEGGRITFFSSRRYYTRHGEKEIRRITFATGCALLIRGEVFDEVGLLSDLFFFGEEDFEFSWRLRTHHIPMLCSTTSKVYHKVGISADKFIADHGFKRFLYVFSRLVDMKHHMPVSRWRLWRILLLGYTMLWLMLKYGMRFSTSLSFVRKLHCCSTRYGDARRATIEMIRHDVFPEPAPER